MEEKIEIAKEAVFSRASLQMRLDQIFSRITPIEASDFLFTDKDPIEVHCIFDNGIDPDPDFSGPVKALLYIDDEKNYCLTISPLEAKPKKMRTEILKKEVGVVEYEFLPPQWTKGETKLETEWPKEKKKLPSLIRMKMDGMKFAFFLPTIDPVITFFESEKK